VAELEQQRIVALVQRYLLHEHVGAGVSIHRVGKDARPVEEDLERSGRAERKKRLLCFAA